MHIKLWFTDFWSPETVKQIQSLLFYQILQTRFKVTLDSVRPDFLIYGNYGFRFYHYDCPRILLLSYECLSPNFIECDFGISLLDSIPGKNHYWNANMGQTSTLPSVQARNVEQLSAGKTHFCNFIYSKAACEQRNRFFHMLSQYKKVHAAGSVYRNTSDLAPRQSNHWVSSKIAYLRKFKFTIAFENTSVENYTTEKILHPIQAGSVPIYWGNPNITRDVNNRAFINCHDFPDFASVVSHVRAVDTDDNLYRSYLSAPVAADGGALAKPYGHTNKLMLDALQDFMRRPPMHIAARHDPLLGRYYTSKRVRRLLVRHRRKRRAKALHPRHGLRLTQIPIYILSLPSATERREKIAQRFDALKLSYKIVDATGINGIRKEIRSYPLRDRMGLLRGLPLSFHEIACFLSHVKLWKELSHMESEHCVILEDDAEISDDFVSIMNSLPHLDRDFDVVRLSGRTFPKNIYQVLCSIGHDRSLCYMPKPLSDTVCSLYSRQALQRLVEHCKVIDKPIDTKWEEWWKTGLRMRCVYPPPVTQQQNHQNPFYLARKSARANLNLQQSITRRVSFLLSRMHMMLWNLLHSMGRR